MACEFACFCEITNMLRHSLFCRHLVQRVIAETSRAIRHLTGEGTMADSARNIFPAAGVDGRKVDLIALVSAVSLACHKSRSFDEALTEVLRLIAENLNWPVAHAIYADHTRVPGDVILLSSGIWYQAHPGERAEFRRVTESFSASAREMPLTPQWRDDVRVMPHFARAVQASGPLKVAAAFNLPVVSQGKLVAVAEFFHSESAARDDDLLAVASMLGHHLALAYEASRRQEWS